MIFNLLGLGENAEDETENDESHNISELRSSSFLSSGASRLDEGLGSLSPLSSNAGSTPRVPRAVPRQKVVKIFAMWCSIMKEDIALAIERSENFMEKFLGTFQELTDELDVIGGKLAVFPSMFQKGIPDSIAHISLANLGPWEFVYKPYVPSYPMEETFDEKASEPLVNVDNFSDIRRIGKSIRITIDRDYLSGEENSYLNDLKSILTPLTELVVPIIRSEYKFQRLKHHLDMESPEKLPSKKYRVIEAIGKIYHALCDMIRRLRGVVDSFRPTDHGEITNIVHWETWKKRGIKCTEKEFVNLLRRFIELSNHRPTFVVNTETDEGPFHMRVPLGMKSGYKFGSS